MHIEVTDHGEILVVGSRRIRARLHGQDLRQREAIIDRLIDTQLLAEELRGRLSAIVARTQPSTVDAWETAVCAACTDDDEAVEAYLHHYQVEAQQVTTQLMDRSSGLGWMDEDVEEEQHVHVHVHRRWTS